ncbi:MAG: carboxypeptidase M32 [Pirellula sp.]|nr:carboxypeptidase M32 [Pirellula sp.]
MMEASETWNRLLAHVRETALLESTAAMLEWDEHTGMPVQAAEYRAEQLMLLSGMIHQRRTDPKIGEWLKALADSSLASEPNSPIGASIRCMRRDYDKHVRLPESLVKQIAKATSLGQQAWVLARKENAFQSFRPHLEEILSLRRQEADLLVDEGMTRYDALLDQYEEGARISTLSDLFSRLRDALVPLIHEASLPKNQPHSSCLAGLFDLDQQRSLSRWVAEQIGFDFSRGRLDETEHPFCTTLGPHDHRILTRYHSDSFSSGLFGVLHEAGHGMYEQGLPAEWYGTPAAAAASLGVHESQSRLWENHVGLSREFWQWCLPHAQERFTNLQQVTVPQMVKELNRVEPSLIRIEADEVTYNLHILIRFELEVDLINGSLSVADLPEEWNRKYQDYLGIMPTSDAVGVLQDVHWSAGLIGYFPTYTLGNMYAAMLFDAAERDIPDLKARIQIGSFLPLLEWLRDRIHVYGRRYAPMALIEKATGHSVTSQPLIDHLDRKVRSRSGASERS